MATETPPPSEGRDPADRRNRGANDAGNGPGAGREPESVSPNPLSDDTASDDTASDGTDQAARAVGVAPAPNRIPPPVDPYSDDFFDPQPYAASDPPVETSPAMVARDDTEDPVLTWRPTGQEPWPTWPKPADFSPVAQFEDPYEAKPQSRSPARAQIPPSVPLDPILPYISPPVPRRRRSDWPVLAIALIVSALVMMTCCIAGFALYSGYAPAFL